MTAPKLGWWWAPALVLIGGLALIATDRVRPGALAVAGALALAAALRAVLPSRVAGGLGVRSRGVDVLIMAGLALALAVIALWVDLTPRA